MQQCQEFRNDAFYLIGNEYLIAIQLNLITLQVDIRLNTGEIEDTSEVEWIVYVQVNPEHRLITHRIEGAIETLIVLFLQS